MLQHKPYTLYVVRKKKRIIERFESDGVESLDAYSKCKSFTKKWKLITKKLLKWIESLKWKNRDSKLNSIGSSQKGPTCKFSFMLLHKAWLSFCTSWHKSRNFEGFKFLYQFWRENDRCLCLHRDMQRIGVGENSSIAQQGSSLKEWIYVLVLVIDFWFS